jgi:hypothetical protein
LILLAIITKIAHLKIAVKALRKNTAEIAQGVVKSQEKYRDDVLTAHDIPISSAHFR